MRALERGQEGEWTPLNQPYPHKAHVTYSIDPRITSASQLMLPLLTWDILLWPDGLIMNR